MIKRIYVRLKAAGQSGSGSIAQPGQRSKYLILLIFLYRLSCVKILTNYYIFPEIG